MTRRDLRTAGVAALVTAGLLAASLALFQGGPPSSHPNGVLSWHADNAVAEHITTPEDASIPGVPVDSAATAKAQADIIQAHALEATGGRTWAACRVRTSSVRSTSKRCPCGPA